MQKALPLPGLPGRHAGKFRPGRCLAEQQQLCGLVAKLFQAGQNIFSLHGRKHAAVLSPCRHFARVAGRVHLVCHGLPEGARRLGRGVHACVGRGLAQHPVNAVGHKLAAVGKAIPLIVVCCLYIRLQQRKCGRYLVQHLARLVGNGDIPLLRVGGHARQGAHGVCKFPLGKIADNEPPVVTVVHGLPRRNAARPQRQRQQKQRQLGALLPGRFGSEQKHKIHRRRTPHKGQQQGVVLVAQPRGGQCRARNNIVWHGLFGRLGKAAKRPHKPPQRQQHQGGVDVVAVYAQRELRPAGGQPQHRQKHKPARGVGAKKRLHGGQQHQAGRGVQKLAAHKEVHMQHV